MATGFFALLDDIAILADDIAVATKISTQKTAVILADDLAVNAQKAVGFKQDRELKVIWEITKGSFLNKLIILPLAFILSVIAPSSIAFILVLGGLYLLYEGVEKIEEYILNKKQQNEKLANTNNENILDFEKSKIKSAVFTDFILSIEIVILALNAVSHEPLIVQIFSTTFVAIIATLGVYGLVALIIRLDNIGFWLISKKQVGFGNFLINLVPKIITILSVLGTIAMVLVGGGILVHNIDFVHHNLMYAQIPSILNEFIIGLIIGGIIVLFVQGIKKIRNKKQI